MPAQAADGAHSRRRRAALDGVLRLSLVLALAGAAACAAALRRPTPQDVRLAEGEWPGTTLGDLERGRAVYVRRCAACHGLHLPSAHPSGEWPSIVRQMAPKARLSPDQARDVTRFVVTMSRRAESTGEAGGAGSAGAAADAQAP